MKHQDGVHRDVAGFIELGQARVAVQSREEPQSSTSARRGVAHGVREGALLAARCRGERRNAQQVRRRGAAASAGERRPRRRHHRGRHHRHAAAGFDTRDAGTDRARLRQPRRLGDRARGRGGGRGERRRGVRARFGKRFLKSIRNARTVRRREGGASASDASAPRPAAPAGAAAPPPPPATVAVAVMSVSSPGRRCPWRGARRAATAARRPPRRARRRRSSTTRARPRC